MTTLKFKSFLLSFLVFLLVLKKTLAKGVPVEGFVPCKYGDDECVKDQFNALVQKFPEGIPEIGWPPFDPFVYDELKIEEADENFSLKIILRNLKLVGLSTAEVTKAAGLTENINGNLMELEATIGKLDVTVEYEGDIGLLGKSMVGSGSVDLTITGIEAGLALKMVEKEMEGEKHLQVDTLELHFDFDTVTLNELDMHESGNEKLAKMIQHHVNHKFKDIFNLIKPSIELQVGDVFKGIFNDMGAAVPYKDFFAEKKE